MTLKQAIEKYGFETVESVVIGCHIHGEGSRTMAFYNDLKTRQGDAIYYAWCDHIEPLDRMGLSVDSEANVRQILAKFKIEQTLTRIVNA